jgi:hypothetical protein
MHGTDNYLQDYILSSKKTTVKTAHFFNKHREKDLQTTSTFTMLTDIPSKFK